MKVYFLTYFLFLFGFAISQNTDIAECNNSNIKVFYIPFEYHFFIEMDEEKEFLKFENTKTVCIYNIDTINLLLNEFNKTISFNAIGESVPDIRVICIISTINKNKEVYYIDNHRYIYRDGKKYGRNWELLKILYKYTDEI